MSDADQTRTPPSRGPDARDTTPASDTAPGAGGAPTADGSGGATGSAGGPRVSRRAVITAGALGAIGGAAVTAAGAGLLGNRGLPGAGAPGAAPSPSGTSGEHAMPGGPRASQGSAAGFTYFNPLEVNVVQAAAARLIPTDEHGPGATEAGVVYFIDRQLSADFGFVGRRYIQGPFAQGTATQGDQNMLPYRQRYKLGVLGVQAYAQQQFGKGFAELTPDQQDQVLKDMEAGRAGFFAAATLTPPPNVRYPASAVPAASPSPSPSPNPALALTTPGATSPQATAVASGTQPSPSPSPSPSPAASPSPSPAPNPALALSTPGTTSPEATAIASSQQPGPAAAPVGGGISAQAFFQMLRGHVIAGFLADPVHGGNRDMVGWKLIGFPGVQNYEDWITRYNTPFDQPFMSLADHQRTLEPGT